MDEKRKILLAIPNQTLEKYKFSQESDNQMSVVEQTEEETFI